MKPVSASSRKLIPALLFACVVATSCGRQNNVPVPATGTGEKQPAIATQPQPAKPRGTTPYDNVHCGLRDKSGNLWFGTTSEGVYRYDGKSLTTFTQADGLPSDRVYSVFEDRSGNIWFGTEAGACRYDGKTFTPLPIPEPSGRKTGSRVSSRTRPGPCGSAPVAAAYRTTGQSSPDCWPTPHSRIRIGSSSTTCSK